MSWQAWNFGSSGSTLIDGANILTGTVNATALVANSITANQIKTGTITTTQLAFAPVVGTDVIASINASTEQNGASVLTILGSKIHIDGSVSFGAGYNPATANATLSNWGFGGGTTYINGGLIQTNTIQASSIAAGAITTDKLAVGTIQRQNIIANGQFGSVNATGNTYSCWTLLSGVTFTASPNNAVGGAGYVAPAPGVAGTYTPFTSVGQPATVALYCPALSATVMAQNFIKQAIAVTPGRTYSVVGLVYGTGGTTSGRIYLKTVVQSNQQELSSATTGISAGSVIPPFYLNAVPAPNGSAYSTDWGVWNLYAYRVTVPSGVTLLEVQIGTDSNSSVSAITLYPGFIQVYDDDTNESTIANGASQLQAVAFGGDIQGAYNALVVRAIQGTMVANVPPTDGQVLAYSAAANQWKPTSSSGGSLGNGITGASIDGGMASTVYGGTGSINCGGAS